MNFPTTLNGSDGWARVPFQSIGTLPTGPEYNVNARLSRTVPITDRVKAEFMFEAYNVFNMQYNTSVNTIAYTAVPVLTNGLANGPYAGTLRPVPGLGLGNAANGFPDGTNARRIQVAIRIVF
jgi:hypothetical protein